MELASLIVGIAGLVVAVVAGGIAVVSITRATAANKLSVKANALSVEANEIADREERRHLERNDVVWDGDWRTDGIYRYTNTGRDPALQVHATLTVDGEHSASAESASVAPGQWLEIELLWAAGQARLDRQELRAAKQQGMPLGVDPVAMTRMRLSHSYIERVTWTSPNGTPHVFEPDPLFGELHDIDS